MLLKHKKNQVLKGNMLLISVTILGSAGLIRFVVNDDELGSTLINTTLKSYAREGRLPILGSYLNNFILYCPIAGTEALSPWEKIGSVGVRDFLLCKKPQSENSIDSEKSCDAISRKGSGSWRSFP